MVTMISNSALQLHSKVLEAVTNAPFRFFATTNTGTITNRFGEDMELIDMTLCIDVMNFLSTTISCLIQLIIMLAFARYLGATVPVLLVTLYFLQRFYLRTSRQIRLLGIEAKAALYTTFTETVAGATSIRAFGWQEHYQRRAYKLIDISQRPTYIQACIQHWLGLVMDLTVCILCVALVATVTTWKSSFSAGSVGVSLVMIVDFNTTLSRLIITWTKLESSVGAVTRCKVFATETEKEDGFECETRKYSPDACWPISGTIELRDVTVQYRYVDLITQR
jgi:ATP-binding cassette subfamily C (CFTR/MRP) protein 1